MLEGKRREVWNGDWSESCLDLHMMSCGAASAMVHAWLLKIRSVVFEGCELPKILKYASFPQIKFLCSQAVSQFPINKE